MNEWRCFTSLLSKVYVLLRYWMSSVSICSVEFHVLCVRRCIRTFDWLCMWYYDYSLRWIRLRQLQSKVIFRSLWLSIVQKQHLYQFCCSVNGNTDHLQALAHRRKWRDWVYSGRTDRTCPLKKMYQLLSFILLLRRKFQFGPFLLHVWLQM